MNLFVIYISSSSSSSNSGALWIKNNAPEIQGNI